MPEFYHSNFATFDAWLHAERSGGTQILVKAPSLGKVANVASLLAAPFTGGASLAANAALRGGMLAAQGVKAARAGKALQTARGAEAAALAQKPPKVAVRRGSGANTQAARRQTAAEIGRGNQAQLPGMESVDPNDVAGGRAKGFESIQERAQEAPKTTLEPDQYQETLSTSTDAGGKTQGTMDARMELEQAQSKYDEMNQAFKDIAGEQATPATAAATGAVGVRQLQQGAQAKEEKKRAEMERIERIAEDGRAKANTGAKVAVA